MIRVAVFGAGGRMGTETCRAIAAAPDLELVACIDPAATGDREGVALSADPKTAVAAGAEVVVDFTNPEAAPANLAFCRLHGIHVVVGTSGFDADKLDALRAECRDGGPHVCVVPNFAIGAVLMMRLAELAAPHLDRVEVIEIHHDGKLDAPSGTAVATAERLGAARAGGWPARGDSTELVPAARGAVVDGIRVHSVRLPGPVASQEVVFGAQGQMLTLRHDTFDRSSFMPGVLLAVREVPNRPGLTVGLEPILGI